ncbi:uncharacterized protein LOC132045148 [Lycium ferocissimum]|uniref:uncharacterized protein LOC132045148 n=1 Tax=Lycium ferocissimum TaxID=112874 RepID=UPI002814FBD6|nr:uncharacterized protein LOC132045148 [Lycium ferocissimum]
MDCSTQLIYISNGLFKEFHKISLNPIQITHYRTTLHNDVEVLASCKGLILFDFDEIKVYCVFNLLTRVHQLIAYPEPTTFMMIGKPGLAVYYSSCDQYKLVTISKLAENPNLFYKFHVLSSERPSLWREIQLRSNTFSDLAIATGGFHTLDNIFSGSDEIINGFLVLIDNKQTQKKRMKRVKGMGNSNIAEGSNAISVSVKLQDDLIVGEIISRLPLKLAVIKL